MDAETKERIERLRALEDGCGVSGLDVIDVFVGNELYYKRGDKFRDYLIDLLERSDPDEWTDGQLRDYGLVRMPCDMDGESIYAGDKVYLGPPFAYCAWTVHSVTIDKNGVHDVCLVDDDGNERWFMPNTCTHHPPVTVESVLREFLSDSEDAMRKGYDEVPHEVFAEYAKRLRLVKEDE